MCVFDCRSRRKKTRCARVRARSAAATSPRIVAHRDGLFEVGADDWSLVENYRFGTRTCDFLICRRCGVFIAAVTQTAEGTRAVVNANCLSDRDRFTSVPVIHNFDGETSETRSARHAANWMPALIRR
jgi:hypothetical protein